MDFTDIQYMYRSPRMKHRKIDIMLIQSQFKPIKYDLDTHTSKLGCRDAVKALILSSQDPVDVIINSNPATIQLHISVNQHMPGERNVCHWQY